MITDWDTYFFTMCYVIAMKSKDESTKIGSIIIDDENTILSTGYNSFPRGINDNVIERQERPLKYKFFSHSERNAIYSAAKNGISIKGSTIYTLGMPCCDCCFGIIQSGIKEVVLHKMWCNLTPDIWLEHAKITEEMFNEANVKIRYWDKKIMTDIYGWNRGLRVKL